MKKQALGLALLCALSGCWGSSLEGSWRSSKGGSLTFRSGDSVTLTDTDGSAYSGKWREVGQGQVELTFTGFMDLGGPQVCDYQLTSQDGGTLLWVNGCTFAAIYRKQ